MSNDEFTKLMEMVRAQVYRSMTLAGMFRQVRNPHLCMFCLKGDDSVPDWDVEKMERGE